MDGTWAETGDRYMLKLFRDYVFHQVTEDGRPWLDMAHVVQCLNKLDAGVPEKVIKLKTFLRVILLSFSFKLFTIPIFRCWKKCTFLQHFLLLLNL